MVRETKKSEEKSGVPFILIKSEYILNNFTVNIKKRFHPQKLRNVLLSFPSLLYLQCMHTVWGFFCFCSVKTNLDEANCVLSSAQTNQGGLPVICGALWLTGGAAAPWNYQSPQCQVFGQEEESSAELAGKRPLHYSSRFLPIWTVMTYLYSGRMAWWLHNLPPGSETWALLSHPAAQKVSYLEFKRTSTCI